MKSAKRLSRLPRIVRSGIPVSVVLATGFVMAATVPGYADGNLNCNAYAKAAVAQQQRNLQLKCGYGGRRWSLNYQRHFNWCRHPNVRMANLTFEDRARRNALNSCQQKVKTKSSDSFKVRYCKKAATNTQSWRRALQQACKGLPEGREWPANWRQDFNTCLSKGGAWMDRRNAERKRIASACARKKRTKTFTIKDRLRHNTGRYGWLPIDVCDRKDRGPGTSGLYNTCGKRWANLICKRFGYAQVVRIGPTRANDQRSSKWGVKADRPSTWWLGAKRICHGKCYYFTSITCTK